MLKKVYLKQKLKNTKHNLKSRELKLLLNNLRECFLIEYVNENCQTDDNVRMAVFCVQIYRNSTKWNLQKLSLQILHLLSPLLFLRR